MIASIRDRYTARLFQRERVRKFQAFAEIAYRKLVQLDRAQRLEDLARIPGNHLERLKRDRQGQHSIRINRRFRVCFRWVDGEAHDVEVVDYH